MEVIDQLRMLLHPLEDPADHIFQMIHFIRDFHSRDRVIASPDLLYVAVSLFDDFLRFLRKLLPGIFRCLLFHLLGVFLRCEVLIICLVAGDQTGLSFIQMSFQKHLFLDHFLQILPDKFLRLSHAFRQVSDCSVRLSVQCLYIRPESFNLLSHMVAADCHNQTDSHCRKKNHQHGIHFRCQRIYKYRSDPQRSCGYPKHQSQGDT